MLNLDACRSYLQSQAPTLLELAAWMALSEQAAIGEPAVADGLLILIQGSTHDDELCRLAAGPVRELLMAEGDGYAILNSSAKNGDVKVHRVLHALRRHSRKAVAAHRNLRRRGGVEPISPALLDDVVARLKFLPETDFDQLPPLPGDHVHNRAGDGAVVSESSPPHDTSLDALISMRPLIAWQRLLRDIEKAESDDAIQSLSWYLGLLMDSAEDLVGREVLKHVFNDRMALALDAAGLHRCSERFLDSLLAATEP